MHRKGVLMVFKPAGFCPYPIRKKDPNPQSEKNAKTNFQSTNQVAIARALLVESKVVVLDEALAGLDDATASNIFQVIYLSLWR